MRRSEPGFGLILVFALLGGLVPMKASAQPEVRVIVYAEAQLLEWLESDGVREAWLETVHEACGCRVESVGPAPGDAWVLRLPDRPDAKRVERFLTCLREQPYVDDAEPDEMLQPVDDDRLE